MHRRSLTRTREMRQGNENQFRCTCVVRTTQMARSKISVPTCWPVRGGYFMRRSSKAFSAFVGAAAKARFVCAKARSRSPDLR